MCASISYLQPWTNLRRVPRVCACVRVCACACVRVCACACVRVCAFVSGSALTSVPAGFIVYEVFAPSELEYEARYTRECRIHQGSTGFARGSSKVYKIT